MINLYKDFEENGFPERRVLSKEEESSLGEIARDLDGIEYDDLAHSSKKARDIFGKAKENGIVILYALSDDLVEFDGAVSDEAGCYVEIGGRAIVSFDEEGTSDDGREHRNSIEVFYGVNQDLFEDRFLWHFRVDLPHKEFGMYEEGEPFCKGLVFLKKDMI